MSTSQNQPASNNPSKPGPARATRSTLARGRRDTIFRFVAIAGTTLAITILFILLATVVLQGAGRVSWTFITSMASYQPEEAGIWAALIGTVIVCGICAVSALPLGVGSAILIEEFKPKHPLLVRVHSFIETNIRNLAGVPSIVYGILGVTAFASMLGLFGTAGQSGMAIGQRWYDQYVDAQGNLLFVPVDGYETPPTPLYDGPVQKPKRIELWRGPTHPLLVGTDYQADEDAEIRPDLTKARVADADATLGLDNGRWVLTLAKPGDGEEGADAEPIDFTDLGVSRGDEVRFGFLFDAFTKRTEYSAFTVQAVQPNRLVLFGKPVTSFIDAAEPGADSIERQVMARDSFGPMVSEIEAQLDEFEDVLKDGINASREGSRNTGPARIDSARAGQIVDAAIAAGPFTGDTSELREELVGQVAALDGKDSRQLRAARRSLTNAAIEAEKRSRLKGKALAGQNPNRVDHKSWYYVSLPFGRGVLAGGLTLMLVILPVVIVASQEALRGVPSSYRQGALALGATKWQSVSKTALPAAIPGICTGTILAISRAIGEAAPILILGGVVFINFTPANLMDSFTVMPLQIYSWAGQPKDVYRELAAGGIIVLLAVLLTFNSIAILIRQVSGRHR
ncbi:MAG: ABC transporter permease subunit [Phycisphaeraceae bacterium]